VQQLLPLRPRLRRGRGDRGDGADLRRRADGPRQDHPLRLVGAHRGAAAQPAAPPGLRPAYPRLSAIETEEASLMPLDTWSEELLRQRALNPVPPVAEQDLAEVRASRKRWRGQTITGTVEVGRVHDEVVVAD